MRSLRRRAFLGPMAASLAAVFFAVQVFACCYSTSRMARALASLLSAPAVSQAHACCARSAPAAPAPEKTACGKGCCLQDGSGRAPQLASVPSDLPAPQEAPAAFAAGVTYALPPARDEAPVAATGPPLYLKTLRLLV